MCKNRYKLPWVPDIRTGGARAELFAGGITVQVQPAYSSGNEVYGKMEILIGLCCWSREARQQGNNGYFYNRVEDAKFGAEEVVEKMLRRGIGLWDSQK